MNTSKSRPLAKVFWPVMLLTAALSLPVDTQAAPSPNARHEHSERADRAQGRNQQKQQKQEAKKQESKTERRQAQQVQRVELQRQQAAAQRRQAEIQRKAQLQRQAQLQQQRKLEIQRQANLQRQTELQRRANLQRQAELRRQAELQRRYNSQRYVAPRNRVGYLNGNAGRYRYYDRNNGRYYESRYSRGDTIVVDGYLTREGYSCQALRDDNGELYMLVGNTFGLRGGDHARVTGRVVDGGYCNWEGTAFEITDVKALWADRRHQAVYYHHSYDGESFGDRDNWFGRRPRAFSNRIER
ncbi:MAG: hypothetical protein ABUT39_29290 [Acidobacteriota bacterium]